MGRNLARARARACSSARQPRECPAERHVHRQGGTAARLDAPTASGGVGSTRVGGSNPVTPRPVTADPRGCSGSRSNSSGRRCNRRAIRRRNGFRRCLLHTLSSTTHPSRRYTDRSHRLRSSRVDQVPSDSRKGLRRGLRAVRALEVGELENDGLGAADALGECRRLHVHADQWFNWSNSGTGCADSSRDDEHRPDDDRRRANDRYAGQDVQQCSRPLNSQPSGPPEAAKTRRRDSPRSRTVA
jgi:hypothetical protein